MQDASGGMFSVCALFYGDYPKLAERWVAGLEAATRWQLIQDVRLGLNAVSPATLAILQQAATRFPVPTHLCIPEANVWKYPLMGAMFRHLGNLAPYTVWFDDDSWIVPDKACWFSRLKNVVAPSRMLGKVYTRAIQPEQWTWIERQAWRSPRVNFAPRIRFITGGFWAIDSQVLSRWNWPSPDLRHNGGDYMLGELCRHQGISLRNFEQGIRINANDTGKPSSAKRRGGSTTHVGAKGAATGAASFNLRIESYGVGQV